MSDQNPASAAADAAPNLECTHTESFARVLSETGITLCLSTYQAHKLVLLRARGGVVNTHYRAVEKPMGIALSEGRLAVGMRNAIRFYARMDVPGWLAPEAPALDALYVQKNEHVTGGIDIHEMEYSKDGSLYFLNTRMSCLCRYTPAQSFDVVWRPDFITTHATDDRCHLNGMAMVDDRVRYVTMLGDSDAPSGWRERKVDGGLLMDIDTGQTICSGLSMPHSPRFYNGGLFVLESGNGSISQVDPASGKKRDILLLPGFTRGLDFYGPLAFVGLSQVRESNTFSGLPLTERPQERVCGVAIVDLRNGALVGYLRFESGVEEIFAVRVLPGDRNPDIVAANDTRANNLYHLPEAEQPEIVLSAKPEPAPESADETKTSHATELASHPEGEVAPQ